MSVNKTSSSIILKKSRQILTDTKFLRTVEKMMINIRDFSAIYSFIIPEDLEQSYKKECKIYKSQPYNPANISFIDFALAKLAQELKIPLVSYDNHISQILSKDLGINVIWPEDIHRIPVGTPILLDTNIILGKFNENPRSRQKIQEMLSTPGFRFLIPYSILEEYETVLNRNKKGITYRYDKKSQPKATILKTKPNRFNQHNFYKRYNNNY